MLQILPTFNMFPGKWHFWGDRDLSFRQTQHVKCDQQNGGFHYHIVVFVDQQRELLCVQFIITFFFFIVSYFIIIFSQKNIKSFRTDVCYHAAYRTGNSIFPTVFCHQGTPTVPSQNWHHLRSPTILT